MVVLDDFLAPRQFAALRDALLAPDFPWGSIPVLGQPLGAHLSAADNRQEVHGFYLRKPGLLHESGHFPLLKPLLGRLRPDTLLRVKLNRTARNTRHVEYGLHIDLRHPRATTAVFYLNTNNGYTLFEGGEKVASVANRIVLFPAALRHTGASCTDADHRMVLNLNMVMPPGPWAP